MSRARNIFKYLNSSTSGPYRLFFSLGLLFGIASVGVWSLFSFGDRSYDFYPGFLHVYGIISLFLGSFVLGFLLTALPRFTATRAANMALVSWLGLLIFIEVGMLIFDLAPSALFATSIKFLSVGVFAMTRFRLTKFSPPPSFVWIFAGLSSVVMGATGKALTELGILQSFEWAQFAHLLFTRGFILSLFMAIGSRLYPALSGVLRVEIVKNTNSSGDSIKFQKLMHGFLALCFFGGLAIESFSQSDLGIGTGLFVQFLVITIEVGALWKMYRKPAPFMRSWMLSVSSWSMILGYAIAMMAPNLRTHCLHIVYVAGFLGGTLAIGAHVLVNHEAMDQALLKNFWPLGFIGALVIAATILRVGAVIDENYYALLSGAASITLVIALSFWGGTYIDPLWRRAK